MIDWKQALKKIAKAIGISSKAAEEKRSPEPNRPQVLNITRTSTLPPDSSKARSDVFHASKQAVKPTPQAPSIPNQRVGASPTNAPATGISKTPVSSGPVMTEHRIKHPGCETFQDQSWQQFGSQTKVGNVRPGLRSMCTVGLDFGTAFTKACVQVRNSSYVVHWDRAVRIASPFLLPSVFSTLSDGTCVLGNVQGARQFTDLKMALLGTPTEEDKLNATIFIALTSRYARSWLFSEHRKVVEGYQLDWALNVGLPASSWDDEVTRTLYRSLALAGWRLGCTAGPITFSGAKDALLSVESRAPSSPGQLVWDMVEAIPEFAAQIHSYRCSAQRQRDLHLLVDVGAGTVDIVTFHVGDEIDTETPVNCIMESTVQNWGTHVLLRQRAHAGSLASRVWDDAATTLSRSDFEIHYSLQKGALVQSQGEFSERIDRAIRKVLLTTQRERYATSPAWTSGIPFFLTGGGRTVDAYREAIAGTQGFRKLIEMSMPVPTDTALGKLGRGEFHRISVAHGLSFPALNLAKTLGKDEVPPLTLPKRHREDYRDSYIEK